MRLLLGALLVAGGSTSLATGCRAAPERLFNGRDLSGWTTWLQDTKREDPRRVFTVRDGVIRISGDGFGYLATEKSYRDYRLSLEFKWGARNWRGREGKARDSGLFLHASGEDGNSHDGNGAFKAALECQIMQGAVGDLMIIRGRGVDVGMSARVAPDRDRENWPTWKEDGERFVFGKFGRLNRLGKDPDWKDVLDPREEGWSRVEALCRGDRISIRVDGTLVNEAFDVRPAGGQILLQCEGSEIYFRNLEIGSP